MFTTDLLIALWFVTTFIVGAYAYFKGAKTQLEICSQHRHDDVPDWRWEKEMDISKRKF